MDFDLVGEVSRVEVIAVGKRIRELSALRAEFGGRRWGKLKGVATVRLEDGAFYRAELHWYEARGIGRQKMKIKRLLSRER